MWLGYVSFGFIADRVGRKRTYVTYLIVAAVLVPLYATSRHPALLLVLGPLVAFFGTGYFSGFGAVTAEIFPTRIRATAQGLTYNLGPWHQRRGAVHRRRAGDGLRPRRGAARDEPRVSRRGDAVDVDPGNARARASS